MSADTQSAVGLSALSGYDDGAQAELLGHIYDVAIAPERIEQLVAYWAHNIERTSARGSSLKRNGWATSTGMLPANSVPHLDRVEAVLKAALRENLASRDTIGAWVQQKRHAAFAVNTSGIIISANAAALAAFGVSEGSSIRDIVVAGEDDPAQLFALGDDAPKLMRLRGALRPEVYAAALTRHPAPGSNCVGITADFIEWPGELSALLGETYALTTAEIDVLQALVRGQTAVEVSERSGRSLATVRTHIRALIEKTGARSQIELIRLTLGLMSIAPGLPAHAAGVDAAPFAATGGAARNGFRANPFKVLKLPDGRDRAYVETGDPAGRPFLLFPGPLGWYRFAETVERAFASEGLRMVAPLRASLGPSSLPPKGRPVLEVFADDTLALMDALGIERAPVVCMGIDLIHGVLLANRAPKRITAVIGAGGVLPANEPEHVARLEQQMRFIITNTRAAPRITNILTYAFVCLGQFWGPERPLRMTLKNSPHDLVLLDDPTQREALTIGSPVNVGADFRVHEACSKEIEAYATDWRDDLINCPVPVVLLNGDRSPFNPVATLMEFAARSPNIQPVVVANAGMAVAHQRPDLLIAEVLRKL